MRHIYPDQKETEQLYNQTDDRATKQDIIDLENQIQDLSQSLDNLSHALTTYEEGMAESVNTSALNAATATIGSLQSTLADIATANLDNLTVSQQATLHELIADTARIIGNLNADDIDADSITANSGVFNELEVANFNITNWQATSLNADTIIGKNITATQGFSALGQITGTAGARIHGTTDVDSLSARNGISALHGTSTFRDVDVWGELEAAKISTSDINWLSYQSYTHTNNLYLTIPHFENGAYYLRAVDGEQRTLFTAEIRNSINNYIVSWSQKEIGIITAIYHIGADNDAKLVIGLHFEDQDFSLYYADVSASDLVAPSSSLNPPDEYNSVYQVIYQDGTKFFKAVDLANSGSSGILKKRVTDNRALATRSYDYDGTEVVNDYDYLPDQSLNKADDVEFHGLDVHDFSTDNMEVPGTFKAGNIYNGPGLTTAERQALPDETLLIETGGDPQVDSNWYAGMIKGSVPTATNIVKMWALGTDNMWAGTNTIVQAHPNAEILWDTGYPVGAIVFPFDRQIQGRTEFAVIENDITGVQYAISGQVNAEYGAWVAEVELYNSNVFHMYDDATEDYTSWEYNLYAMNGTQGGNPLPRIYSNSAATQPINSDWFYEDHTGEKIYFEDPSTHLVNAFTVLTAPDLQVLAYMNFEYQELGGNGKLTRKTTINNVMQIKPIVPYNENGTTLTDNTPLVYDHNDDTIKKATGNVKFPADVEITGDLIMNGDVEFDDATAHNIEAHNLEATNDLFVNRNAVINGDLEVRGTTFSSEVENVQSDGDWIVLRANNPTGLNTGDYAGIVFHKYNAAGKDAAITVDNTGTFRLSTQTEESVSPLANTWLVDSQYFKENVSFQNATLLSENYPVTRYSEIHTDLEAYKVDTSVSPTGHLFYDPEATVAVYYPNVIYFNNAIQLDGTPITWTPSGTDVSKEVHFYTSISFMEPQSSDMEPVMTRDETANLTDKALLQWDNTNEKAKTIPAPTQNNTYLKANLGAGGQITYSWGTGGGVGVSFIGTRAAYNQAKLIPVGQDGHIPSGSLVIITDENDFLEGENK